MEDLSLKIDGVSIPGLLYGTAWKEEQTQRFTKLALSEGFRGIDTANQRRHYDEAAVGKAIAKTTESGLVNRNELFLQTKFTFRHGQDHRLPYDPSAPISVQVEQSFASSLAHLGVERIDSYLLHGPMQRSGLTPSDGEAWAAMEAIQERGGTRFLGISNVSLEQLQALWEKARIRPQFVQNRCYANRGWDRQMREFCMANGLIYQGFSLLTANRDLLTHPALVRIAKRHGRSASQIVFRFAIHIGMIALTGTSDDRHMREDLEATKFQLDPDEIKSIEELALS